jgi:hypothetical protein
MNFQDIFQAVEVQSISAKNGNLNPLEVYIELKNLETFVKECKDLVQLDALSRINRALLERRNFRASGNRS